MKYHLCIPIEKALELLKKGRSPLTGTPNEQLRVLTEARAAGKKYFAGCDMEDVQGLCAGHSDSPPLLGVQL